VEVTVDHDGIGEETEKRDEFQGDHRTKSQKCEEIGGTGVEVTPINQISDTQWSATPLQFAQQINMKLLVI
jgi:hypothetical protein